MGPGSKTFGSETGQSTLADRAPTRQAWLWPGRAVQCDPDGFNQQSSIRLRAGHITLSVAAAEHGAFLFALMHFFSSIHVASDCLGVLVAEITRVP